MYRTIILPVLPVVSHGYKTLSLILGEKHRLRAFENRVLRRIFGPKKDNETGSGEDYLRRSFMTLYSSLNIRVIKSIVMRWSGLVARMGDRRSAYRVLVWRPEGKTSLGRPRRRWEDNIKTGFLEAGWGGMDWIELAQDRDKWRALVNVVMNLRFP
jgi:hypothetical protein